MAKKKLPIPMKDCSWKDATEVGLFESEDAAKEFLRSQSYSFDILKNMELSPQTFAKKARFDFFAAMSSDINPTMRKMANLLVRDSTPKAGNANYVRPVAVSEIKAIVQDTYMGAFHKANDVHLKAWLLEQKALGRFKMASMNTPAVREEFANLWARLKRGERLAVNELGYNTQASRKAVDAMVDEMKTNYDSLLQIMKQSGIEGAENVAENFNYINRKYSPTKMQKVLEQPNGLQYLKTFLVNAMQDTMVRGVKSKPLSNAQKIVIA